MNFIGHAMAARWERDHPRFVLGSMLPDFAHMCRVRLETAGNADVAAGVRCHHRVDAAFHGLDGFRALMTEVRPSLRAAGVPRGTALAAVHVGVELLLDGCWLDEPGVADRYREAVTEATRLDGDALGWAGQGSAGDLGVLCQHLLVARSSEGYRDPDEVGRRVARILARRPRLAPGPGDEARLRRWARQILPRVREAAPALGAELRDALRPTPRVPTDAPAAR